MSISSLLRMQAQIAHQILEGTMADVTETQAHWTPPGIANPLGATYAHVLCSEDVIVHGMLQGAPPLAATSWAGRTGLSEPMPMPGPEWSEYPAWTRRVRVDLSSMRQYAQAVYAATDTYLGSLSDEDMDKPLDLSSTGLGPQTLGSALALLVLNHIGTETGEIACLKGLQGARGYPF
jgi:hypothetical protein